MGQYADGRTKGESCVECTRHGNDLLKAAVHILLDGRGRECWQRIGGRETAAPLQAGDVARIHGTAQLGQLAGDESLHVSGYDGDSQRQHDGTEVFILLTLLLVASL